MRKYLDQKLTKEQLLNMKSAPLDEALRQKIKENWDHISKPLDGLGTFETVLTQIGTILQDEKIDIAKKAVLIFCADNGVVKEGVSQTGQEVTAVVAERMVMEDSSVGRMGRVIGAKTFPIDIGIHRQEPIPGIIYRNVRKGTRNFAKEQAMTEAEVLEAISVGIGMVKECKEQGYRLVATGEMGIGNTTTSSAVAAALLQVNVEEVTGRGAGLDDKGLARKRQVIQNAIAKYGLKEADAFTILQTVGGLDIAGLAGVCIGGAMYHMPVILDGVISMVAALCANALVPGTDAYLIASHSSKEPAGVLLRNALHLEPVIYGKMALGEGTGAVMMMALLDLAVSVYQESTTFEDVQIDSYRRFTKK